MSERTCSYEGCLNRQLARGWCPKHYARWRTHGDPSVVNRFWGGDDITYNAAHRRVEKIRGFAKEHLCVDCGSQAKEWSYDGNAGPRERVEDNYKGTTHSVPYSLDPEHYSPRCVQCHRGMDSKKERV